MKTNQARLSYHHINASHECHVWGSTMKCIPFFPFTIYPATRLKNRLTPTNTIAIFIPQMSDCFSSKPTARQGYPIITQTLPHLWQNAGTSWSPTMNVFIYTFQFVESDIEGKTFSKTSVIRSRRSHFLCTLSLLSAHSCLFLCMGRWVVLWGC